MQRTLSVLALTTLFASPLALADNDCQTLSWLDLSAEDASIIASVRPQRLDAAPVMVARKSGATVLYSVPDYFWRMSDEDLSQIRSVQPQGEKVVVCPRPATRVN
jgi:hypothetical protein